MIKETSSTLIFNMNFNQKLFLLCLSFLLVAPLFPIFIQSFSFKWLWPSLLPEIWWWDARQTARLPIGWDYIFSSYSHLYQAVINTLIIGISVSLITLVLCYPAAKVMVRKAFPHKNKFEYLFSLPLLIPEIAIGLSLVLPFIYLGWSGNHIGVILVQLVPTIPYMMRILTNVIQTQSVQFEEQARLLGANRVQIFRYISWPMLFPGILAGCLFTFLVSSNIFLLTFLIGQGSIETIPTLLFAKLSGGTMDATAAGLTLIAMIPGVLLLITTERHLRRFGA